MNLSRNPDRSGSGLGAAKAALMAELARTSDEKETMAKLVIVQNLRNDNFSIHGGSYLFIHRTP
jgi:hypothetical protein